MPRFWQFGEQEFVFRVAFIVPQVFKTKDANDSEGLGYGLLGTAGQWSISWSLCPYESVTPNACSWRSMTHILRPRRGNARAKQTGAGSHGEGQAPPDPVSQVGFASPSMADTVTPVGGGLSSLTCLSGGHWRPWTGDAGGPAAGCTGGARWLGPAVGGAPTAAKLGDMAAMIASVRDDCRGCDHIWTGRRRRRRTT